MAKCFRKGLKYVFTEKNFKKDMGFKSDFLKYCNGQPVEIKDNTIGRCRGYKVVAAWCKCIGEEKSVF